MIQMHHNAPIVTQHVTKNLIVTLEPTWKSPTHVTLTETQQKLNDEYKKSNKPPSTPET